MFSLLSSWYLSPPCAGNLRPHHPDSVSGPQASVSLPTAPLPHPEYAQTIGGAVQESSLW